VAVAVSGFAVAALVLALAVAASAQPLAPKDAPEPLQPWVSWVLRGHEAEQCSLLSGQATPTRVCAWPTRLALELGARSGRFEQSWRVERRLLVALPGDAAHWPHAVKIDGIPAPVASINGRPAVELDPGSHRVGGSFRWDSLPELLQIPAETALLSLVLETDGVPKRVSFPNRDAQGRLWLRKSSAAAAGEESRLELLVHRRLVDEVPLRLETRVEIEVSGRSREMVLGRPLPDGFVPMSLQSPLPARIDPDGRLRVQLRPGRFELKLEARQQTPAEQVGLADPGGAWAASEVWVFEARPALRLVAVEGGVSVDPQQTKLPTGWKNLPAYLLKQGDSLRLVEKRRGDSDPAPDQLALFRTLWLDFDGGGYTIQDRIEGEIRRSSRLEMGPGTRLGRVELNGRDQFITRLPDADEQGEPDPAVAPTVGIEVPRGAIELVAESRVEAARAHVPAVGWQHDFQELAAQLQLPPGWRLLHASGVDRARFTWVNQWNLLDIFTALIIVLAFGRLFGARWGAVAVAAMLLSYTEPGAPRWSWLAVLAGEALARALPSGRLASWLRVYRGLALAVLVLVAVPFAVEQVRLGLHPALEEPAGVAPSYARGRGALGVANKAVARREAEAPKLPQSVEPQRLGRTNLSESKLEESVVGGLFSSMGYDAYAPDPGARITTGPGLPGWSWRSVELRWNGPVTHSQELRLLLAPPWLTGLMAFVRVALLAALAACLVVVGSSRPGVLSRFRWSAAAGAWLLSMLVVAGPRTASAELPSQELLDELRSRLLAAPECLPHCATSASLRVVAKPSSLSLELEFDVLSESGVPLPGNARSWLPHRVRVDGAQASALRVRSDGVVWLQLSAGRHRVELTGPLPERDSIELALPLPPHRVSTSLDGWVLHGLLENGRSEGTLQLVRIREQKAGAKPKLEEGELPPFVLVARSIRMGLTWQVDTQVRRLTPVEPAILLELPLLPGEAVTTPGIRVRDGQALVALGPGVRSLHWTSNLDVQSRLELTASTGGAWKELWRLDVSPIWHVEIDGIPAVHQPVATAARVREWQPWPGESVTLQVTRPVGLEGNTATVDSSELRVRPGLRATDATLALSLRSSRGGEHRLLLPEDALLQSVTIGGVVTPIRQDEREVTIPLVPGSQQISLAWRQPRGVTARLRTPAVDLGMPSVNASLVLDLPSSRWVLATGGPRLGPAVLFWSYLAVLAALAFALGRIPFTPLRFHHWALLGVGLTQVPIAAAATVVVWLIALGWRREYGNRVPGLWFDALQLLLAFVTAAALVALLVSVRTGLLGLPEMQIAGNGSTGSLLRWYQDRADALLPQAWVLSVPLLVYRIAMLAWALWLAQALLRWLRWGWECFTHGELWRPLRQRPAAPTQDA
jgi:hypothetical protein